MKHAPKNKKSNRPFGRLSLFLLLALMLFMPQTRVWGFPANPVPEVGKILVASSMFIGENCDEIQYDASGYTVAPKTTPTKWPSNRGFMPGEGNPSSVLPGNLVDRYGGTGGGFLSPKGTPAAARSLAPGTTSRSLNTYKVVKPFEANAGRAAPWFGQPGKGIQYDLGTSTVQDLINSGHLLPQ